ncbi:MAG: DUF1634 domain-containing protein [Gemmatimonadales bacterium]|nr:DUF1634 domain-containing protein [Gemmatimonadales bacterium]
MSHSEEPEGWSDHQVEQFVGNLLRYGVLLAAAVALIGGVFYLARHGSEPANYRVFRGQPAELTSVGGVLRGVGALNARAVIQLGILLLIATPIARVIFTLIAFVRQRDRAYIVITLIVLAVLLYSLLAAH